MAISFVAISLAHEIPKPAFRFELVTKRSFSAKPFRATTPELKI